MQTERNQWGERNPVAHDTHIRLQVSDEDTTWSGEYRREDVPCQHMSPRELDITHQWSQTGNWVASWAFVSHYYQPVIRRAYRQLWMPSEGSCLSPFQSPSPCCSHYTDRLRLSWSYWNATGATASIAYAWKTCKSHRKVETWHLKKWQSTLWPASRSANMWLVHQLKKRDKYLVLW